VSNRQPAALVSVPVESRRDAPPLKMVGDVIRVFIQKAQVSIMDFRRFAVEPSQSMASARGRYRRKWPGAIARLQRFEEAESELVLGVWKSQRRLTLGPLGCLFKQSGKMEGIQSLSSQSTIP